MELSNTAKVILGMLQMAPRTGYEIKAFVDISTRFFWAASYSQLYPELQRLKDAGLINGAEAPVGGRRRVVYELTPAGEEALRDWLEGPEAVHELRDEGLLKLFFAGAIGAKQAQSALAHKREYHRELRERLTEIEPGANGKHDPFLSLTLQYGLDYHEWAAQWCEDAIEELGGGP